MNWNNNDTKYIFKRILLLIITCIIFFTGTRCAKATTISSSWSYDTHQDIPDTYTFGYASFSNNTFTSAGEGYLNFTVTSLSNATTMYHINQMKVFIKNASGNDVSQFICDQGSLLTYNDSNKQIVIYSVKCPVNIGQGQMLSRVEFYRPYGVNGSLIVQHSNIITFSSTSGEANAIVAGQQQTTQDLQNSLYINSQNEISAITQQTQSITNSISQQATQAHSDSQAEQQAINNNTQAVNDLNDNIMEDYELPDDIDAGFEFSEWFSQEDSDFIRGILLFPFRIFTLISGALDSNTCIEYSFGRLFGYELKLPCINYKQYIGNAIYIIVDTVFALVIVFGLIRYMISVYDFVFSIGLKGASVVAAVEVFK